MKQFICYLIILSSAATFGQKVISNQKHAWLAFQGNHKFSKCWGLHTEYQWRRNDFFKKWQQSLTRIGVDYYTKNKFLFSLGYAWIKSYKYGDQPISNEMDEHRIWQQFQYKTKFQFGEIQHRYRLEQRFLENWQKNDLGIDIQNGFIFRNRLRYRVAINIPLNHKEIGSKTLCLNLFDEIFLGFGKGISKNIFDQNRFNAGLSWIQNETLSFNFGYLNQTIAKSDGIKMERNHTLMIGFVYNFILKSK